MQNIPLVSVSLITYNHEKYIAQALEGVLMQKTDFRFEIVIGEDCSTDNTKKIIQAYEISNPGIIYAIYNNKNVGAIRNYYNTVLPACRGKYIAVLEGDDYWTDPFKLQKQVDFLEANPEYGLCYTDIDSLDEDTNTVKTSVFENKILHNSCSFEEHLLGKSFIAPLTWMFRKDLLSAIDPNNTADNSFAMALDFYKNTKIKYLPVVTAVYRSHAGSASYPASIRDTYNRLKGVLEIKKHYLKKYPVNPEIEKLVLIKGYLDVLYVLRIADKLNDNEFISEAASYFSETGLEKFLVIFNENKRYRKEYNQIAGSNAYKLGKLLLKPFSYFRKKAPGAKKEPVDQAEIISA